jgi:MFS family permease
MTQSIPPNRWWSLCVVGLAVVIVTTDAGQLSIALPVIIAEFNADLSLAAWVALVYALVAASLRKNNAKEAPSFRQRPGDR